MYISAARCLRTTLDILLHQLRVVATDAERYGSLVAHIGPDATAEIADRRRPFLIPRQCRATPALSHKSALSGKPDV
jgi:hypothetical protein